MTRFAELYEHFWRFKASSLMGKVNHNGWFLSRMLGKNARRNLTVFSALLLVFGLLLTLIGTTLLIKEQTEADDYPVYVGIDVAYGDEAAVYKLVDAVQGSINLIVLGSLNLTTDTAKLTRVCDYLYQKGLHFIVFVAYGGKNSPKGPDQQFFQMAANRWGDKFLGTYVFDEVGGKQIDYPLTNPDKPVHEADNYSDAAQQFLNNVNGPLRDITINYYESPHLRVYTSDYALYWYDYLVGYDVVFGEFVGNQSRQLSVALCRGAAKTLGKDWGTMITWKYHQPPFLEDAEQLYDDMVLAYQNGAKYIVVFNSPANFTATTEYGILTPEHIDAFKKFWNYMNACPYSEKGSEKTAYVLPRDYGFGFRGPDDRIWGLWGPDALSPIIWNDANSLLKTYGTRLDIVYETKFDNVPIQLPYDQLIFWNGTTISK
jgi:hypothetical protein